MRRGVKCFNGVAGTLAPLDQAVKTSDEPFREINPRRTPKVGWKVTI